jgi:excisionase family DNA binding protein
MRVRDVAARLDISPSLVYRLIAAGKLRCTRHGLGRGCIRISEEQLADYLRRSEPAEASGSRRLTVCSAAPFRHLDAAKLREAWRHD